VLSNIGVHCGVEARFANSRMGVGGGGIQRLETLAVRETASTASWRPPPPLRERPPAARI